MLSTAFLLASGFAGGYAVWRECFETVVKTEED